MSGLKPKSVENYTGMESEEPFGDEMPNCDLVMKGSEIASHHGGVVTKGLEIPSDPVRSSHKGRSRKILKFPGPS